MKQISFVTALLLSGVLLQAQSGAYLKVINGLRENKIQLNNPLPPKGYKKFFDCDSNVVYEKRSGDTIKFFTWASAEYTDLEHLLKLQQRPYFNIIVYPQKVFENGAITLARLEPKTFLISKDSIFLVNNHASDFMNTMSYMEDKFTNNMDSLAGDLFGYTNEITTRVTDTKDLENLSDIGRIRSGKSPSKFTLIFHNNMFRDSGFVVSTKHSEITSRLFGNETLPLDESDRVDLLKKWQIGSETCYCIKVGGAGFQKNDELLFTSGLRFPDLENCEVNKKMILAEIEAGRNTIAQRKSDSIYNARKKLIIAKGKAAPKVNCADSFVVVGVNHKAGFMDKNGNEVIPVKYQANFSFHEGLAAVAENERYGFINEYGEEVIPLKYQLAYNFSEGLAAIKKNNLWGYISKNGKEAISCKYDSALFFYEGIAAVQLNKHWGFINSKGMEIIGLKYEEVSSFSNGLCRVKLNGHYGFINKQAKEVVKIKYDEFFNQFRDGLIIAKLDNKSTCVDENGNELFPFKYDGIDLFSDGLALAGLNRKLGLVDKSGREVVPLKYDIIERGANGMSIVAQDGRYGILDKTGKEILPMKYDQVGYFSEDLFVVKVDEKAALINKDAKEIIPFTYSNIEPCRGAFAIVQNELEKWGLVDSNGKEVVPPKYDNINNAFSEGLIVVGQAGKSGFFDKKGKQVIPFKYDEADAFYDGLAQVKRDNMWGYVDTLGNEVVSCRYDWVQRISNGQFAVSLNGKSALINRAAKEITPFKYDKFGVRLRSLIAVEYNGKWGFIDSNGKEVIPFMYDYAFVYNICN